MVKLTKVIVLFAYILLSSCALSKAIYIGKDVYSSKTGPESSESLSGNENINGLLPEAVYIKTRTQTFNAYHYYILNDGLIWYKSIDGEKEPANWTLFDKSGLPHNGWKFGFNTPRRIVELSADADELTALSDEGGFYRFCFDKTIAHKSGVWLDRQGWPNAEQLFLDRRTAKNLSWALGKRNDHVLYYEDPFGNQHHNGTMEIATTYVLLEDGQEICYADPGIPADFSRNYIGPERGAFKAVSLSASASTMFVINESGEMYTRLADFDTIGCDPMWFKYTYIPYKADLAGTNYFSNLNEWGLPAEDWRPQAPIPLDGKAAITRHITILQNGQGNGARELRVAGLNEAGETGYWTKAIFADIWEFKVVPLYFSEDAVLKNANSFDGNLPVEQGERGLSPDKYYGGYYWRDGEKENGWEYAIPNFNILEGDCDFSITWQGETCTLKLHSVEMWSYLKRNYLPGRTGSPKMFMVTLEIPENAFDGLSAQFITELTGKYAKNDKKLFQYVIAASNHYLLLRDTNDTDSVLFLTDGIATREYTEFQQISFVKDIEEIERYSSPELTIDHRTVTHEELTNKIELNETFRDELKYKIRVLKWSQLTAFKINFGYLPAHYIARMTHLRFVDMPKIRTITTFGERVVSVNSSYTYTTSNIRIFVYEKIIELLEVRIRYYNDIAKGFSEINSDAAGATEISFSPWRSETITGYWDIAGLPHVITGTFFSPQLVPMQTQRPAVLSFVRPETEPEIFGWYLSIGESGSAATTDNHFSIFIDPLKSPGKIYSRNGKAPEEKKVRLDCTIYINPGINAPGEIEQEVIDRALKPFLDKLTGNDRGIKARIIFDGARFEIREHPTRHGNSLIFRGEL